MKLSWRFWTSALVLGSGIGLCVTAFAGDDDAEETKKRRVIVIEDDEVAIDEAGDQDRLIIRNRTAPKFWIGVACSIDEDHVSVGQVIDDSPAAKAGLKAGDQIVSVGDQPIKKLPDLVNAVQSADPISMKINRDGKTIEVNLTPVERPHDLDRQTRRWRNNIRQQDGWEDWEEVMPQLRDWLGGDLEDFDLSMIQPGVVVGPTEIPNGVSISVHRDGDGPAKITIRRGDDSWEVTEDSIDELPQDLRGTARKMLSAMSGKMLGGRRLLDFDGKIERMLPGKRLNLNAVPFQRNEENAKLKAEIESMRKEIEELRQLLKELKDNQTE